MSNDTKAPLTATDLGPCVTGCAGRLRPVISKDGSAWEAERCDVCNRKWMYTVPRTPSDLSRVVALWPAASRGPSAASRGPSAAAPTAPTPPIRNLIDPPPGSTAGVTIEVMTSGPLAGWAVVDIPAGGVLGEDEHPQREIGIMLAGIVEVHFGGGGAMVPIRYSVPPGVRHSLRALDADVRILARLEDAGGTTP
jgi:quercetin dioxygenase-like cupin family protein